MTTLTTRELPLIGFMTALWAGGALLERFSLPALVGEILVGMALGPNGADILPSDITIALQTAGNIGLLLMVAEGGLMMELSVLKAQGCRATVLALTGTILPVVIGGLFCMALGYETTAAIASGTALSSTAIGFTLRLMTDLKLLDTAQGQLITAAAMLDDVFSLVLLAMISVLDASTPHASPPFGPPLPPGLPGSSHPPALPPAAPRSGDDSEATAWLVMRPLVASLAIFAIAMLVGVATLRADAVLSAGGQAGGVPKRSAAFAWLLAPSTTLGALLGGAVTLAWAADALHSSALLGAFLAGTIFCSLGRAREAWQSVAPVQAWLATVFFGASVAFTIPTAALVEASSIGDGLLLTVAAIVGKFASGAWAAPLRAPDGGFASRPFWVAWTQVGSAMIGRGELGFVLAKSALDDGLLGSRAYCATVWALLLATLLGPIAFRLSLRLSPRSPADADAVPNGDAGGGVVMTSKAV